MLPDELHMPAPQGLSATDAASRLKADGPNELPTPDQLGGALGLVKALIKN